MLSPSVSIARVYGDTDFMDFSDEYVAGRLRDVAPSVAKDV